MPTELTDQDCGFRAIRRGRKAELVAACRYEFARELRHVRTTMKKWLALQKERDELIELVQKTDEATIEPNDRQRLSEWSSNEHAVQKIESARHLGAPRLRFLAKHLVEDRPWLTIPSTDQDNAIASALKDRSDVPRDADGLTFFRSLPPAEPLEEWRDLVYKGDALYRSYPGEWVVGYRIQYAFFTNKEIIEAIAADVRKKRPEEWKHKAKDSGRRRSDFWWAALKQLAAMRLLHALPPKQAIEKFCKLYSVNIEESNFRELQRDSISTFQWLFNTDEEPRHAKTWTERRRNR
jgi:hypothetical protein